MQDGIFHWIMCKLSHTIGSLSCLGNVAWEVYCNKKQEWKLYKKCLRRKVVNSLEDTLFPNTANLRHLAKKPVFNFSDCEITLVVLKTKQRNSGSYIKKMNI